MQDVYQIINSPILYCLVAVTVLLIITMLVLFVRLSYKSIHHEEINLTKKDCNRAIYTGIMTAVGPSLGVVVVMIALIAFIGSPMAWERITVIGGVTTELAAATTGIQVAGGDPTQPLTLEQMSVAWWTMTINACGWLVVITIFGSRMEKLRNKLGGGDPKWIGLLSNSTAVGLFGFFLSNYIYADVVAVDYHNIVSMVVAAGLMLAGLFVSKKVEALRPYILGIATLVGILTATLLP